VAIFDSLLIADCRVLIGEETDKELAMTFMRKIGLAAVLIAAAVGLSGCSYNRFVSQEEAIKAQWAQVENQLQRRNDLIPNLVETVKGIAQQEKDVFGQIADSRAKLAGAQTPEQRIEAANEQSAALARLLVIVENYPQLRSNESFNRLMDELAGTENRIAQERRRYNQSVQEYNTSRRSFPANITASLFGFKEYPLFNAPPEAERVPKVNFGRQAS
jgi:LemA protein